MRSALRVLRWLVRILVLALFLATAVSYLGRFHWAAELLSHFRVQCSVAAALGLGLASLLRIPRTALLACLLLGLNLVPTLPYLWGRAEEQAPRQDQVRLLMANVLTANKDYAALRRLVRRENPDVIALLEVDPGWVEALRYLTEGYPHGVQHPQSDNFGIALVSRIPLANVRVRSLVHEGLPFVEAEFLLGGESTRLVLAHPVPPVGAANAALRNRQFAQLAALSRREPEGDFVLLADLNATPWSPHYRRLEVDTGLVNAALGLGFLPTWSTQTPLLSLPLDHCLISSQLEVLDFRIGPQTGSDHRPVIVDLARRKGAADPSEAQRHGAR